jgi:putative endonuclease
MFELNEGIYKFYVYILTNKSRIVLYTGVIGNLHQRLFQHVHKVNPDSFTSRV